MKKILLLALALTNTAFAQSLRINNAQQFLNADAPRNYILNSGAERNVLNITNASSIATQTTSVPLEGDASYSINATATSQLVVFLGAALQSGLLGGNCEAKFTYSGDASLYTAYATLNGVRVSDIGTLQNIASGSQPVSINFLCGVSTTDVASVVIASTGDGAIIKVDSVYIGAATNVGSGSQASVYGSGVYTGIASCTWPRTGAGSNSFAIPAADADCSAMAVTGRITAPGTRLPQIIATDAPSGRYVIYASFAFQKAGASDSANYALLSDGTTESGNTQWYPGTAQINAPTTLVGDFNYTSAGTRTWSIQTKQDVTSNTAGIDNGGTDRKLSFTVLYFPNSEQVLRIGAPYIAPTAYTPTITGGGTVTGNSATAQCVAGMLYMQGRFTTGTPTAVEARISLPPGFTSADSGQIPLLRQVGGMSTQVASASSVQTLIEPSVTYLTAGLQNASFAGVTKRNGSDLWAATNPVSWFATVPVTPDSLCASVSMPLVRNAVTTSSTAVAPINWMFGTNNGSVCAISSSSNGTVPWISTPTRGGTGLCAFVISGYSTRPSCQVNQDAAHGVNVDGVCQIRSTSSSTALQVTCGNNALGAADRSFSVTCVGN